VWHDFVRTHEFGWPFAAYRGSEPMGAGRFYTYQSHELQRDPPFPPIQLDYRNFIVRGVFFDFVIGIGIVLISSLVVQCSLKAVLRTKHPQ
jgi:hypothetical protein